MGNNPVGKKVIIPKGNTQTFLRKYREWLKVRTFLLLALGFYVIPSHDLVAIFSDVYCF